MPGKVEKKKKFKIDRQQMGLLFILPWLIGFVWFQLYPFVQSFLYSLTDFNGGTTSNFIGLTNYINILQDSKAIQSLLVTIVYVIIAVPCKLMFALFIAMLLNKPIRGLSFFRTAYYIPSILGGSVAVAVLWRFLFVEDGVVNHFLSLFGIGPIGFLNDERYALLTVSLLSVWQFGSSMILFLAALKQVPNDLYEAASIDGITRVGAFFNITIPMITPVLLFNIVMQIINAFQEFTSVSIITKGGPMNSTNLFCLLLYQDAFMHGRMGYASALSWVLFIVILIVTLVILRTSSSWVFYSDGGDA